MKTLLAAIAGIGWVFTVDLIARHGHHLLQFLIATAIVLLAAAALLADHTRSTR